MTTTENEPVILKTKPVPAGRQMFLLDKTKRRPERFSLLHPQVVSTAGGLRDSLARATKDTLWVSYEKDLTEALLKSVLGPPRSLGKALLIHALNPLSIPVLTSCFKRFASASNKEFLPPDELAEALQAVNSSNLFIGGSVDPTNRTITLWRGNLEPLTVPFSAFEKSGDGIEPNFDRFSVTDSGQTVRFGDYEAAADAILYEFDPEYRRHVSKERRQSERTFGASLRRLRKQRGLRREDFEPKVAAKTIARIEQGLVHRIQKDTLNSIADRLQVRPEEIETY
jgi:hypothetical protein